MKPTNATLAALAAAAALAAPVRAALPTAVKCDRPDLLFTDNGTGLPLASPVPAAFVPDADGAAGKCLRFTKESAAFLCSLLSGYFERGLFEGSAFRYMPIPTDLADAVAEFRTSKDYALDWCGTAPVGGSTCGRFVTDRALSPSNAFRIATGDLVPRLCDAFCPSNATGGVSQTLDAVKPSVLDLEQFGGRPFPDTSLTWQDVEDWRSFFPADLHRRVWRSFFHLAAPGRADWCNNNDFVNALINLGVCVGKDFADGVNPSADADRVSEDGRVYASQPTLPSILSNFCGSCASGIGYRGARMSYARLSALSWAIALCDRSFMNNGFGMFTNDNTVAVSHSSFYTASNTNLTYSTEVRNGRRVFTFGSEPGGWEVSSNATEVVTNGVSCNPYVVRACTSAETGDAQFSGYPLRLYRDVTDRATLSALAPSNGVEYPLSVKFDRETLLFRLSSGGMANGQFLEIGPARAKTELFGTVSAGRDVVYSTDAKPGAFDYKENERYFWPLRLGFVREFEHVGLGSLSETTNEYVEAGCYVARAGRGDRAAFFSSTAGGCAGFAALARQHEWLWNSAKDEAWRRYQRHAGAMPDRPDRSAPDVGPLVDSLKKVELDAGSVYTLMNLDIGYSTIKRTEDGGFALRPNRPGIPAATNVVPLAVGWGLAVRPVPFTNGTPVSVTAAISASPLILWKHTNLRAE